MGLAKRVIGALLITGAAALSLPPSACAQERVGVVTNLEGTATVARLTLPQAQPLRFKDGVYLHDRITTGERSIVRVLLGGKATVTARERSVLTITEVPGTSTIELGAGRISVAVSKGLMKPGEVVEIRTPNAVTAIRGTVVVAEVFPVAGGVQSTITVLRGLVDVTRLDPVTRQRVGPSVDVGTLQAVTAIGSKSLSGPAPISPDEAQRLTADFRIAPSAAPSTAATAAVQQATRQAALDAQALLSAQSAGTGTLSGDLSISGTGSTSGGSSLTVGGTTPILNLGSLLNVGTSSGGSDVGVVGVKPSKYSKYLK
jgi:FecR protein